VYKCLHGWAPDYLSELCTLDTPVAKRQHLHSASRPLLVIPRFQTDMYGHHAFTVAGLMTWKLFYNDLCSSDLSIDTFWRTLKTYLFRQYLVHSAHQRHCATMHYTNRHLHYIAMTRSLRCRDQKTLQEGLGEAAVIPLGLLMTWQKSNPLSALCYMLHSSACRRGKWGQLM